MLFTGEYLHHNEYSWHAEHFMPFVSLCGASMTDAPLATPEHTIMMPQNKIDFFIAIPRLPSNKYGKYIINSYS